MRCVVLYQGQAYQVSNAIQAVLICRALESWGEASAVRPADDTLCLVDPVVA